MNVNLSLLILGTFVFATVTALPLALSRRTFGKFALTTVLAGGGVAIANKVFLVDGLAPPYQPAKDSLAGKTILITGGNTGIGAESAKRLALAGSRVIITSRSAAKGENAVRKIKEASGNDDVYYLPLDLTDLASVLKFDKVFQEAFGSESKIDVLLNNAGVMAIPDRELTKDGFEKQFATNHLGHFALTKVLYPLLNQESGRIINVSSTAHSIARAGIDFGDVARREKGSYAPWSAYGDSKLANILFTNELNRRSTGPKAFSLHPGVVRTELGRYLFPEEANKNIVKEIALKTASYGAMLFTKDVEHGATTSVFLASFANDDDTASSSSTYFSDSKPKKLEKFARDDESARKLWELSEALIKDIM